MPEEQLSKRERKELKKQERKEARKRELDDKRAKTIRIWITVIIVAVSIIGLLSWLVKITPERELPTNDKSIEEMVSETIEEVANRDATSTEESINATQDNSTESQQSADNMENKTLPTFETPPTLKGLIQ